MSLKKKPREWKSLLEAKFKDMEAKFKDMMGGDEAPSRALTPTSDPTITTRPAERQPSSHSRALPNTTIETPGSAVSSWVKSEGWANLKGCIATLDEVVTISGLERLKTAIQGLADCIGIYEEIAQGRQAYIKLRADLECIFEQLQKYLSLSPTVEENISSICGSIQEEIDYVKSQQGRPRIRRLQEAEEDEDKVLACYTRMRDYLQDLLLSLSVSTLAIIEQHAMNDQLRELTPSLSAHYNSGNALTLKRGPCTEGTRMGVLAGMSEWVVGPGTGNIYWMSGMAGTGKTTIAYSLCKRLDGEGSRMLGASFFCSRSLPDCRSVGKIIPSIAYQLAQRCPSFRYALYQVIKSDLNAHLGGPAVQFESLIAKPLSDAKVQATFPKNTVVVIDALDECEDTASTRQILSVLLIKSKGLPIKFVVSSRPEPAIRDQMEKNGTWIDARVVLHEPDSGEVQTDVRTYLKAELAPITPSELQVEQLVVRAGVLFIYAATVVRYVGYDDFGRDPQARLDMVLGTPGQDEKAPTNDVDDLYATILRAAFDDPMLSKKERDCMKLVLNTVICAQNPLTVSTLSSLLQVGKVARVQAALRPLWSVLHVTDPDMTVTTLHASFPDYLFDPTRSGTWHCDAAAHHYLLAQRCFECIRDTKPQFNICKLESSYVIDDDVLDLDNRVREFIPIDLRYACQYWASHLDATESCTASSLLSDLLHFLTRHLLLWMEVRNLTKSASTIIGELMAARRWATWHDTTPNVTDFLSDAWRFASIFVSSPVSQSTPHLYISMLPLLPSSSPIRKQYSG